LVFVNKFVFKGQSKKYVENFLSVKSLIKMIKFGCFS